MCRTMRHFNTFDEHRLMSIYVFKCTICFLGYLKTIENANFNGENGFCHPTSPYNAYLKHLKLQVFTKSARSIQNAVIVVLK